MGSNNVFNLLILILAFNTNVNSYSSKFYEKSFESEYDCSVQFDSPRNFDCACISGLWKFYGTGSKCTELLTIGGDTQYCFTLPGLGIMRAELLLADKRHISIKCPDGNTTTFTKDHHHPITITPRDILTVGTEWTLKDDNDNEVCLAAAQNSYCFFSGNDLGINSNIITMKKGCEDGVASIYPTDCRNINFESKNICNNDRIVKRDVSQRGRVFFGAPGQPNQTYWLGSQLYDEDYTGTNSTGNTSDAIASEIWNFMDKKLDEILGLNKVVQDAVVDEDDPSVLTPAQRKAADHKTAAGRTAKKSQSSGRTAKKSETSGRDKSRGKRGTSSKGSRKGRNMGASKDEKVTVRNYTMTSKHYRSPVYQFLELATEVMIKTCPKAYVNPEFFTLATKIFIKIQKKHFKFPETATSYQGYWRVFDSLRDCIANSSTFNFTSDKCASREKPVSGSYCAFGNCSHEMNVMAGFEDFEPMIETVWNIFKNAHSTCFSYFNQNFNDHHRFTMWMLPLFQNQVNKVWMHGSAKGVVYGGIFGKQENVQTAIAYCTASSQMLSKYPWDLPRPTSIQELMTAGRRKREAFDAHCISPGKMPQCI